MSKRLRVGLKYCGGCCARYNRVAMVQRIRHELSNVIEIVSPHEGNPDLILAIMGCDTACADLRAFMDKEICIITSEQQGERFIKQLKGDLL